MAAGPRLEQPLQPGQEPFFRELHDGIENPSNGEIVMSSFYTAWDMAYHTISACKAFTDEYIATETVQVAAFQVRKLFKKYQGLFSTHLIREETQYPETFTEQKWLEHITDTFSSPDNPNLLQLERAIKRPLQTHRHERADILAFVVACQMLRRRLEGKLTVHDFGAANNHILKALASATLTETVILDDDGLPDEDWTRTFRATTSLAMYGFRRGIGVEQRPPRNEADLANLKSDTLDPSQYVHNPHGVTYEDVFDRLAAARPSNVTMIRDDIRHLRPYSVQKLGSSPADVASLSHVLDQNGENQDTIIDNVLPNMSRRGLLLAMGYLEVNADNPQKLDVLGHWQRPQALILDARHPDEGFFPIAVGNSGRWDKIQLVKEGVRRLAPVLFE